MEFSVKLVERISKNGQPYSALLIVFPSGYEKLVFLTPAEKHLVNLTN